MADASSASMIEPRVERIVGRRVLDVDGRVVGPLEAIRVRARGDGLEVVEYRIGAYALLQRLGGSSIGRSLLHAIGLARRQGAYRVPWDALDLSDPARPRLRRALASFERVVDR